MVKICPDSFTLPENELALSLFPFALSPFQQWTIQGLAEGKNVLNCAHTGSGKTLGAEFAMHWFKHRKQKKVIYTSPIKALSNQKYNELKSKFGDTLSFGICTGDTKEIPQGSADVVIMTTEILLNHLQQESRHTTSLMNDFGFHIEEIGCIIYDEVHYINDADRGAVWEECILRTPADVQLLMLSATIDQPNAFAEWCECVTHREVFLTYTSNRIVPLTHYAFLTCTSSLFKAIKDKTRIAETKKNLNRLVPIKLPSAISCSSENMNEIQRTKKTIQYFRHHVSSTHIFNSVADTLVTEQLLPAICFVLNKKELESIANSITTVLLEDDSKIPYTASTACNQIIRRLPNYKEIQQLQEYHNVVHLLSKGIGIHHASMLPVLREMVEMMFAQGFVKLLFATETFAVGINMPTKTVLFHSLEKFDGNCKRPLYPHEYTQMAGRAGRRGIDTEGHVVHLCNHMSYDPIEVQHILSGAPQQLRSKMRVTPQFLLQQIAHHTEPVEFLKQSWLGREVQAEQQQEQTHLTNLLQKRQETIATAEFVAHTTLQVARQFAQYTNTCQSSVNKHKKQAIKALQVLEQNTSLKANTVLQAFKQVFLLETEIEQCQKQLAAANNYLEQHIQENNSTQLIHQKQLVHDNNYTLTQKGNIALCFKEIVWIDMVDLVCNPDFGKLKAHQLAALLSCFIGGSNIDEKEKVKVLEVLEVLELEELEEVAFIQSWITTSTEENITHHLVLPTLKWCKATSEEECKRILSENIGSMTVGDFVKAMLRILCFAREVENAVSLFNEQEEESSFVPLLYELSLIPSLLLKYVVCVQSLYV